MNLESYYIEGINNLKNWRNRYNANEYPEKVALNIFYRRYTMEFMWSDIESLIEKGSKVNILTSTANGPETLDFIEELYSRTATEKTHPILLSLLKNKPTNTVGGIKYDHYLNLIEKTQNGDKNAKEDLEFSYLYYLLSDKATIVWAMLCATGFNKIQAISFLAGVSAMQQPVNDYTTINSAMGQLCVAPYLNEHYIPLP